MILCMQGLGQETTATAAPPARKRQPPATTNSGCAARPFTKKYTCSSIPAAWNRNMLSSEEPEETSSSSSESGFAWEWGRAGAPDSKPEKKLVFTIRKTPMQA